jgi:hypothetical protein
MKILDPSDLPEDQPRRAAPSAASALQNARDHRDRPAQLRARASFPSSTN